MTLTAIGLWHLLTDSGETEYAQYVERLDGEASGHPDLPDAPHTDIPLATPRAVEPIPVDRPLLEKGTAAATPSAPHDPDDPAGILVYGSVTAADGGPIESEYKGIVFQSAAGVYKQTTLEDEGDSYSLSSLSPGTWTIKTNFTGYRPAELLVELTGDQSIVRADLVVEPSAELLVAVVTPTGEPLRAEDVGLDRRKWGLAAVATLDPLPGDLPATSWTHYYSHGVGTYRTGDAAATGVLEGLPPGYHGRLEVDAPLPVHVSLLYRHMLLAAQVAEPGDEELTFVIDPGVFSELSGSLRFQVLDADTRETVPGLIAYVAAGQAAGGNRQATGDENGVFLFESERPGPLAVYLFAEGYERVRRTLEIEPGMETDLGLIPLHGSTTISGRVLDPDGNPVSTAIRVFPLDTFTEDAVAWASIPNQSDVEGHFVVEHLGRGPYVLSVRVPEWVSQSIVADTTAGSIEGLRIRLQPPTALSITCDFDAARQIDVMIYDSGGLPVAMWTGLGGRTFPVNFAPDRYEYVLHEDGIELRRREFVVGTGTAEVSISP